MVVSLVGCCFCWFFLAGVFLVCFLFFVGVVWSVSFHQWNNIIRLWHYEYRKLDTLSASLAVINTASKHLHNDLAKAIEALEQKKSWGGMGGWVLSTLLSSLCPLRYLGIFFWCLTSW